MIRKKKMYKRPTKAFEKKRMEEENELVKKYGLKNKREVWKSLARLNYFRKRAMALTKLNLGEQEVFLNKLKEIGLKVYSISDVLNLKVEDILDRRLPTILSNKKLANSVKHARQLVTHKKILIKGHVINSPSYLVRVDEENVLSIKEKKPKEIKQEVKEVVLNE